MLKKLTLVEGVVIVVIAGLLCAILFPVFAQHKGSRRNPCISHMKQLGTGLQIYVSDFNEMLPVHGWYDEIMPYVKNEALFSCDKVPKWGYALNSEIAGRDSTKVPDPWSFPMLFETDALARDVIANLAARTRARHGRGSHITRCDTSTKYVADKP